MLSTPMRVQYSLMRTDQDMFESACHEGNYSLPNMLRGARVVESRLTRQSQTRKPVIDDLSAEIPYVLM